MFNSIKKLLFFTLINSVIYSVSLCAGFSINWTGEKSGIITFDKDKYSDTEYQISFNEQLFIEKKFALISWADGSKIQENFIGFNHDRKNENLFKFVHLLRTLAISNKYFLLDAKVLLQKGALTEGKDYKIDERGVAQIIGITNFTLEHTNGDYRSTQINNIILDTDWLSGKQGIRILLD